jgi:hypothetical protein
MIALLILPGYMEMSVWHRVINCWDLELFRMYGSGLKRNYQQLTYKSPTATDRSGCNTLHVAAKDGKIELFQSARDWAKDKLKTQEKNNTLLLGTDNMGKTVWHVVTEKGNLEALQKAWEWAKRN